MIICRSTVLVILIICSLMSPVFSQAVIPYRLYIDADFTTSKSAAIAIKLGIETALKEQNFQIDNIPFSIVVKDHHGNTRRSTKHLQQFINDPQAFAVFGGLHSPPLLTNKDFINGQQILTLVPWAAAGPITRTSTAENWIFRLSIDDSNAGQYIVEKTLSQGFKKPYLLLENTGWGRSNLKNMTNVLNQRGIKVSGVQWFNWGVNESQARIILHDIIKKDADVILFVGNSPEGIIFANEISKSDDPLPIRSHWGITGGDFSKKVTHQARQALDLQFIQTKFSFNSLNQTALSNSVFKQITQNSSISVPSDLSAATGFIHAYDLTRLLISAMKQAHLTGDILKDRQAVHYALERLKEPVNGLIKQYSQPFSVHQPRNINAHDALNQHDYRMGYFDENNTVQLVQGPLVD